MTNSPEAEISASSASNCRSASAWYSADIARPSAVYCDVGCPHGSGFAWMRITYFIREPLCFDGRQLRPCTGYVGADRAISTGVRLFDACGGDRADEEPLADDEQQQHRELAQQRSGHEDRPVRVVGALEGGQPELDRHDVGGGGDDERPEEVVPDREERQDGQRAQRRPHQWQQDAAQDA